MLVSKALTPVLLVGLLGLAASCLADVALVAATEAGTGRVKQLQAELHNELAGDRKLRGGFAPTRPASTTAHQRISTKRSDVCWSSPRLKPAESADVSNGIIVSGQGCSSCVVGEYCSFLIQLVGPTASWKLPESYGASLRPARTVQDPFKWDLMVLLRGPALGSAEVTPLSADARVLRATFRVWDEGSYNVSLFAPCENLNLPGNFSSQEAVASWALQVTSAGLGTGGENEAGLSPAPCDTSAVPARWLMIGREYRWTTYSCAPALPAAKDIPALLAEKGIKEINFVGDSRLRVMGMHVFHYLSSDPQNQGEPMFPFQNISKRGNFSFYIPLVRSVDGHGAMGAKDLLEAGEGDVSQAGSRFRPQKVLRGAYRKSPGSFLRLNFYWSDFVERDGDFGCKRPVADFRPGPNTLSVPRPADVTFINVGTWTGAFCVEPELALGPHMHKALEWASGQAQKAPKGKLVLRSASTWHLGNTCIATNSFLSFANSVGSRMAPRFGAQFFDSWQVEAPRFMDVCNPAADHHYSCIEPKGDGAAMRGDVGGAVVQAFLHHLLYNKS